MLVGDLKLVVRDAEELLRVTAGEANEKVKEVRQRLASALELAKANCAQLEDKAAETLRATDHVIREHPYEAIGMAVAMGLLIGVLVGRR